MISASDREKAITLIKEAVQAGARETAACKELGISLRTLQRWRSDATPLEDQRPLAKRPVPHNKLSQEEAQEILAVVNQPDYKSLPPSQIVPMLADKGIYIASESTFYRTLRKYNLQHHRGFSKAPRSKPIFNSLRHWSESSLDVGYNLASRASQGHLLLSLPHYRPV